MIEINNLSAFYGEKCVLNNITTQINSNEITMVLGANGSGKSTLLSLIAGVQNNNLKVKNFPQIDKISTKSISVSKMSKIVSFTPQSESSAWNYTVEDYVKLSRYQKEEKFELVENAIINMNLQDLRNASVLELSGGEMQRVSIARALAQDTNWVLLDEPTSGLDIYHQYTLLELLKNKKNKGIIISIHDINLASLYGDNIILLKKGQIVSSGKAENVITKENILNAYDLNVEIFSHPKKNKPQIYV